MLTTCCFYLTLVFARDKTLRGYCITEVVIEMPSLEAGHFFALLVIRGKWPVYAFIGRLTYFLA